MRYYVDTEFNGNGGQLLSIALVRQDGLRFYAELPVHELVVPWCKEHVMPLMRGGECLMDRATATKRMRKFLEKDPGPLITFVVDWPEDLLHVMAMLLRDHGKRNPPERFRCVLLSLPGFNTSTASAKPHNAEDDAVALMEFVEQGILDGQDGALHNEDLRLLRGT